MEKIHTEIELLSGLRLNRARLRFMVLFIQGLILAGSVQFHRIAHQMDTPARSQSNFRRIQRFLGQYPLSLEWVGLFILLLIPKRRGSTASCGGSAS
ncbi:MAG: hypothetical protein D6722_20825 [Bacteroidetes bacterium]|nr:MAG: hypothetical protein D6722_20825 [Bacteroidota bacterium]